MHVSTLSSCAWGSTSSPHRSHRAPGARTLLSSGSFVCWFIWLVIVGGEGGGWLVMMGGRRVARHRRRRRCRPPMAAADWPPMRGGGCLSLSLSRLVVAGHGDYSSTRQHRGMGRPGWRVDGCARARAPPMGSAGAGARACSSLLLLAAPRRTQSNRASSAHFLRLAQALMGASLPGATRARATGWCVHHHYVPSAMGPPPLLLASLPSCFSPSLSLLCSCCCPSTGERDVLALGVRRKVSGLVGIVEENS